MEELTNTYQISGTPTVIVGGKYQVKFTGDWNAGMKTIDELAAKVRSERGMKAPAAKPAAAALKKQRCCAGQNGQQISAIFSGSLSGCLNFYALRLSQPADIGM